MPIKKEYSKDKEICQVTFTIPNEISKNFKEICLVGDFNNWDPHQHKFLPNKSDGSLSIVLVIEAGKEFQFRYLCDGQTWLNESEADKQVLTHYGDSKNSVLIV